MSILVQLAEHEWTKHALHQACILAREQHADVILLRLMQVELISYLGSEFGDHAFTHQEYLELHEYAATAEDYGITLRDTAGTETRIFIDSIVPRRSK